MHRARGGGWLPSSTHHTHALTVWSCMRDCIAPRARDCASACGTPCRTSSRADWTPPPVAPSWAGPRGTETPAPRTPPRHTAGSTGARVLTCWARAPGPAPGRRQHRRSPQALLVPVSRRSRRQRRRRRMQQRRRPLSSRTVERPEEWPRM